MSRMNQLPLVIACVVMLEWTGQAATGQTPGAYVTQVRAVCPGEPSMDDMSSAACSFTVYHPEVDPNAFVSSNASGALSGGSSLTVAGEQLVNAEGLSGTATFGTARVIYYIDAAGRQPLPASWASAQVSVPFTLFGSVWWKTAGGASGTAVIDGSTVTYSDGHSFFDFGEGVAQTTLGVGSHSFVEDAGVAPGITEYKIDMGGAMVAIASGHGSPTGTLDDQPIWESAGTLSVALSIRPNQAAFDQEAIQMHLPTLPLNQYFSLRYSPGLESLGRPTLFLPGDADGNGTVDFSDLLTVAQNYGHDGDWFQGDFNHDGIVGFDDLLALAQHYGQTQAAADAGDFASQVPEPVSAIGPVGVVFLLTRRTRRAAWPST